MKVYEVLCSINSGKHDRGHLIHLSDAQAQPLLDSGAVRLAAVPDVVDDPINKIVDDDNVDASEKSKKPAPSKSGRKKQKEG